MNQGRIAVLVSNDLEFDQRVRKTCNTLSAAGWEPILIGRRLNRMDSVSIDRPYPTRRMWLGVKSGPLFYLTLQLAMMNALARCRREDRVTAVWANDLDTLWPAVWAARKWDWQIAYDSHEWFTEAEGLKGKTFKKAIWTEQERRCFKHLDRMLTVNDAIADAYRQRYGLAVEVVPNVPELSDAAVPITRPELGWPEDRTVLLMQGAFMDRDRGALDAVRALVYLPECHLALIGAGPEYDEADGVARNLGVRDRLHLHDRMHFGRLRRCTCAADIGLSLDRPTVDNFRFSLPNKLFDYLHAGLPIVCSDLPVAGTFVRAESIGQVVRPSDNDEGIAKGVASAVKRLLAEVPHAEHMKEVAARHHWGVYESSLIRALHALGRPD